MVLSLDTNLLLKTTKIVIKISIINKKTVKITFSKNIKTTKMNLNRELILKMKLNIKINLLNGETSENKTFWEIDKL